MANRFALAAIFTGIDRMSGPVRTMQRNLDTFARSSRAAFGSMATGLAAVGAGAGAGLAKVVQTGMAFEKTLLDAGNKFQPGIEKSSALFQKLGAAAKEVGGATEFSSSQAALALNDLAGAGFNADQAIGALPGVVNFATAASLDLAQASEVAVKALGAYGMKSDDPKVLAENLQRVTDTLMKTDALSSTNISSIFEAFKEAGPVAKSAGVSLETFSAMVGTLGTAGIEGSVAGTTIKNAMLSLSAPTDEAAASLGRFGIKTKDAAGNLRDPILLLEELRVKTSKMGTADRAGALESIFGKIPIAGVNVLLDKMGDLRTQRDELTKSRGQVELVAASKRSGGTSSWDNLTSAVEAAGLQAFDAVGGDITKGIESATVAIGDLAGVAMPFLREFTTSLKDGFADAWPAVKAAISSFDYFDSKSGALAGVKELAHHLGQVAAVAVGVGVNLARLVGGGLKLVNFQVSVVKASWNGLISTFGRLGFVLDDTLSNIAAQWRAFNFVQFGVAMIRDIGSGILSLQSTLGQAAYTVISGGLAASWDLVKAAWMAPQRFAEIGLSIIKGIALGIRDNVGFVLTELQNLANEMIAKLKGALDMHSPSRKTAVIGMLAAEGVGVGWAGQIGEVNKGIARSLEAGPMGAPTPAPLTRADGVAPDRMLGGSPWALQSSFVGLPPPPAQLPQSAPTPAPLTRAELRDEVKQAIEITVRADAGSSAEVTKKPPGSKVNLQPSGTP